MPNTTKIKNRIAELGYTQSEIAFKIGIASPTMSQKINNLRPFSLEEAEKMASILKIKDKEFGQYFFD